MILNWRWIQMSERLEELKNRVWKDACAYAESDEQSREGFSYTLSDYDYEWIIQQAERVEKLDYENKGLKHQSEQQGADIAVLEHENQRYKQALEFYADFKIYYPQCDDICSWITMDYGEKARQALEESK